MAHRRAPTWPARTAAALAVALLGGCAEMHHGFEAVGRIGGAPAPAVEAESVPARPDIRTVRPRGAPRPPADQTGAAEAPRPAAVASAVPQPRQIFDFHPAGSKPDGWRQPFVIDTSDGPLAADVRRSSAELRTFLADQKAGRDKAASQTAGRRCGESDVATGKAGCGPALPRAAAAQ